MSEDDTWVVSSSNRGIRSGIKDLYVSRAILWALVRRELKSRYRGSILGFAWVLGRPIVTLFVYSVIVGEILGANRSIEYFALYLFVGLMFWNFFAEGVSASSHSIIMAEGLIQKVAFPREILPITSVIIATINTFIQAPILIIGYFVFGKWPSISNLLFFVPLFFILFILVLGLALLLSSVTVYIRDIKPLSDLLLMVLMYSTPLLYSWTFVKEKVVEHFSNDFLFTIYMHNPLAILVTSLQDALWPGRRTFISGEVAPQFFSITSPVIWLLLGFVIVLLLLAYKVFLKLEPNFAREL